MAHGWFLIHSADSINIMDGNEIHINSNNLSDSSIWINYRNSSINNYIFGKGNKKVDYTNYANLIANNINLSGDLTVAGIINGKSYSAVDKYAPNSFNITSHEYWQEGFNNPNVIKKGADLNDFTTPGTYVSIAGEYSRTLLNCPYPWGNFKLFVIQNTGSESTNEKWLTQNIFTTNSQIFHRALDGYNSITSTKHWTPWVDITRDYTNISLSNNGYVSFSNGLILQYGNTNVLNESSIVTLPISFSVRNCATILTVNAGRNNDAMYGTSVAIVSLSTIDCGLYVKNHNDGTSRILNASAWFVAIGY